MTNLLNHFSHKVRASSRMIADLWRSARKPDGITRSELCDAYPRNDADFDSTQVPLWPYDRMVVKFPRFRLSSPAMVKKWPDLVWERGFA